MKMLNCTMNHREDQYRNLNDFTVKIHQEIVDIVSTLGWRIESIKSDNDNTLVCPYDSSHRIGRKSLDQHLESCQWKEEGYNEFCVPLSEPSLPLNSPSSIKLDTLLQNTILQEAKEMDSTINVESYECPTWHKLYILSKHKFLTLIIGLGERLIPRTSDRIFTDFTCDERKVLYEYVVSNTMKTVIGHDITDTHKPKAQDKEDKKLSFLELLVQERNLKRRRAKHRGVHTNKKSYTEILREVINQQMELYVDHITETRAASCDTKTENITETRNSDRNLSNIAQNASLQFNESSSKRHNLFLDDPQNYHGSYSSRNSQKYERFEKSTSYGKALEKREKVSRIATESWKIQKSSKHRSRSRERNCDRSKHMPVRQDYGKNIKSYETKKSCNSNRYSKRSNDRRENRK